MKRIALLSLCAVFAGSLTTAVAAQAPSPKMDMKPDASQKSGTSYTGTGVVKGTDSAAGSITLAHDPVQSLNWPAMTMAFKVQDKKILQKAKVGDKVRFQFVQSGKDYVITQIQ